MGGNSWRVLQPKRGPRLNIIHIFSVATQIAESQRVSFRNPIPKGLRLKAQGCEERATLGKGTKRESTPTANGVAAPLRWQHTTTPVLRPFEQRRSAPLPPNR